MLASALLNCQSTALGFVAEFPTRLGVRPRELEVSIEGLGLWGSRVDELSSATDTSTTL
jgi:hypothetical protein